MADYSLVPVDHQPDFDDVSLVPVEHDPFGADAVTQPAHPQPPGTNVGQANADAPANSTPASEVGESWDPDSENSDIPRPNPSTVSTLPLDKMPFTPFGELKTPIFTHSRPIGNLAADAATAFGM